MDRKTLLVLFLLVFVPSLLIRIQPTTSESFQYDAVISQLAAREGVAANAWDASGTYAMRRQHPPLLSYVIALNNRLFGDDPFHARIFSMVFGSLTCLVVAIAIAALSPGSPLRLPAALFGGWLLCLLPVHLYVSRTSNWDTVYGFFAAGSLACMAWYLVRGRAVALYGAALAATMAFLTCELALFLLPAAAFTLFQDTRRMPVARAAARWIAVVGFIALVMAVLWPAGIFKLDLARTLVFRWRDSWAAERNLPWYGFYSELFRQSPAFTVVIAIGVIAAIAPRVRRAGPRAAARASLPFWIYAATVFVVSLKQRLVYVQHIVDLFPPLVIAICLALAARADALNASLRRLVPAAGVAILGLCAVAAFNPDPDVVGPQEHPGFLGVSDALRDYPGARIYCHDTLVLGFYLPRADIEGGPSRVWSVEDVANARRGRYDFVVIDRAKLNPAFPTVEDIAKALAPDYHVRRVISHRRTNEPVAWIFSPGQADHGREKVHP